MNEFDRILIEQGISLIPRVPGTKEPPAGFSYADRWDGTKIAKLEETASWKEHDRAAVCGVNHLVVFDFDSIASYERFWGTQRFASNLPNETLCVRTSRGIQVWFFDNSTDLSKMKNVIDGKPMIDVEIFIQKHLAAVPNNTHPSGKKYILLGTCTVARKDGIIERGIERLRSLHWTGSIYSDSGTVPIQLGSLSEQITDFNRAVEYFSPFWKRGHTHRFLLALSGYLIRSNISEQSATLLVEAIVNKAGDSSSHKREALYQIHYAYKNKDRAKRLLGANGLSDVMMEIEQSCQK